jgi:hypothetical protein
MTDEQEILRSFELPALRGESRLEAERERLRRVPILIRIVERGWPVELVELVLSGRLTLD